MRKFLLNPSALTTQILTYCLAVASLRTGVVVHAATGMSNHLHDVVTDVNGCLPEFMRLFHKLVGSAVNASLGRNGQLFDGREPSVVLLGDDRAIIDEIAYVACNPVDAGLVERGEEWPGMRLYRPGKHRVPRPAVYFRDSGPLPEVVELEIAPPPVRRMDVEEAIAAVEVAVAAREEKKRKAMKRARRTFLGAPAVLEQSVYDEPKTREAWRKISPRVAARSRRVRVRLIRALKAFEARYREVRSRWCDGDRDAEFPAGTYLLRVAYGARCAEP